MSNAMLGQNHWSFGRSPEVCPAHTLRRFSLSATRGTWMVAVTSTLQQIMAKKHIGHPQDRGDTVSSIHQDQEPEWQPAA